MTTRQLNNHTLIDADGSFAFSRYHKEIEVASWAFVVRRLNSDTVLAFSTTEGWLDD